MSRRRVRSAPTREQVERLADLACELDEAHEGYSALEREALRAAVDLLHEVALSACQRHGYEGIYAEDEDDGGER